MVASTLFIYQLRLNVMAKVEEKKVNFVHFWVSYVAVTFSY